MAVGAPSWQPNRRSEGQCSSRGLRITRTPAVAHPSGYEAADREVLLFGVRPRGAPTDPEPRHVVSCSLVLPGPVRAEAVRKALLVGADRGPVLGPARSRRGSQAGFATRALRGDRSRNGTIGGPGVFRSRNTSVWESQRHHLTMDLRIRRTAAPVASTRRRHRSARTYQREPLRGLLGSRTVVLEAVRPARTPRPEPPFWKLRKQDRVGLPRTTMWSRSVEPTTGRRTSWLRNGGTPVERRGTIPGDHGNDERGNQRQEGI